MLKTNGKDSESHLYKHPTQEDGSAYMNEDTCQGILMTRTHQDGKAHVYENPYQTGIMMNNTNRKKMKVKDHLEVVEYAEDQIPPHYCVAQQTWTKETRTKRLTVITIALELKGGGGHS